MRTETFIKYVFLAKVRAIKRLKNINHKKRRRQEWKEDGWWKNFCINEITNARHHLEFKIQISTLDSMFLASFHSTVLINNVRLNCRIKIYLKANNAFMLESTHKKANLTQNEICAVLCSKRQYKQHDGEKIAMWNLYITGLLNSENPIWIQTETFIKYVLPAKVRAIKRQRPCKARAHPTQARISFWVKVLHNI